MKHTLRILTEENAVDVQELLEQSPNYFLKVEGKLPPKDAALKEFREVPPNFSRENKYNFGFYKDDLLIGFIDILNGYPDKEIAYLGLLLLSESYQKKGLGKIAFHLIESEVRKWQSKKIRLSVAQSNDVVDFWSKMGFKATGRILTAHNPEILSQVIEMEKHL